MKETPDVHSLDILSSRLGANNDDSDSLSLDTGNPKSATFLKQEKENIVNSALLSSPSSSDVVDKQPKRQGYLSWDDYFLCVALLSAKRSKDPKSASGACIVDHNNRIIGIGYSGFPRGCPDDVFPWKSDLEDEWLHTKEPYICHAVSNAILNKCTNTVSGSRIYVVEYPNSESAKMIIQSGIKQVIILGEDNGVNSNDSHSETMEIQAGRILLTMAGVQVRYCKPNLSSLTLDFVAKMTPTTAIADENYPALTMATTEERDRQQLQEKQIAMRVLMEEANYDASQVADNGKSNEYLSWEEYFMAMAFLTAQRSKDPNTQVGACIVDNENRIIGLGYNGFPTGCSDEHLPWARSNSNELLNKYLYVCHAEVNAILNKGSANVKGATIYVALFPCQNCAKMIIQSGIRQVVFMSDAYHDTPGCRASRIMFRCAGVQLRQYIPTMQKLILDLEQN